MARQIQAIRLTQLSISSPTLRKSLNQRMPRQLPFSTLATTAAESKPALGPAAAAAALLLLCAFALIACASHSRKWQQRTATGRRRNSDQVISIHQVQTGAGQEGGDICIWQKGILMGEKCQLPDFSGVITYDSAGNLVAPGRPCLMKPYVSEKL